MNNDSAKIAFIGAGNMARSLIGGLLKQGYAADRIFASDPAEVCLAATRALGDVKTTSDNQLAIDQAEVIVLAVKPQVLGSVVKPLQPQLSSNKPLLISIAAGITCESLQQWAGSDVPMVRCMPNTPALLQAGATGLYASVAVSDQQRNIAASILNAVGITVWVDKETDLDAVTALSGSGPAYFFLLIEAMQAMGEKLGLPADTTKLLVQQTALGAARMAIEETESVAELRRRVTSPNGTTEAAVKSFQESELSNVVEAALQAAYDRSLALAKELA